MQRYCAPPPRLSCAHQSTGSCVHVLIPDLTCRPPRLWQRRRPSRGWDVAGGVLQRRPASGCSSARSAHPGQQTGRSALGGQTGNIRWHLRLNTHDISWGPNTTTHMFCLLLSPFSPLLLPGSSWFLDLFFCNFLSSQMETNPLQMAWSVFRDPLTLISTFNSLLGLLVRTKVSWMWLFRPVTNTNTPLKKFRIESSVLTFQAAVVKIIFWFWSFRSVYKNHLASWF